MPTIYPKIFTSLALSLLASTTLYAASADSSRVLQRADLSGAPGMEVVSSISEYQPGESIPRHFHHGVEAAYIVQGGLVQLPGKAAMRLADGASLMNLRDIPHAGFTVVGEHSIKLFTVHIVDKAKPLYEWVE
jgi:quercetin dioxygenase-like cupin family protein